jgi:hypothetical protein
MGGFRRQSSWRSLALYVAKSVAHPVAQAIWRTSVLVNVTALLHAGENTLQVTVVNTQYNALSARGPDRNFIPRPTDTANDLMPSGLIGPVRLEEIQ